MADPDFKLLVDRWYDPLYRFALSLARNETEAMDLTQQTFARWAEKGSSMREPAKAKSWLFTVLYREFLDTRRWRDRERSEDAAYFANLAVEETGAERQASGREVLDALRRIDPVFRAPVTLFYLESHSYREIAETLDVPIGTVMSRISRGKAQLRALLEEKQARAKVVPLPLERRNQT